MRIKLTLWYSVVLALVLIVFAFVFYFLIEQAVKELADDALVDATDSFATRLQSAPAPDDETIRRILRDFRLQYVFFAIYDRDRNLIAASPRIEKDFELKFSTFNISTASIPKKTLDALFAEPNSFRTFPAQDKINVRIYGERSVFKTRELFIATLRPLSNQTELLADIRFIFLAGIPLALVFSSLGGYYLARKSLEPVREMGAKASLITSRNLNERLPVGGTDDEIENLAEIFNRMLTRLEASFEQQRRFMADASHELRTPLAIMRGEAEVALQKTTRREEEYRESLEIIRQEGVRLSHIVEDLFTLARADAGQYKIKRTTFYLDELIGETVRAVRTLVAGKNLELEVETPENLIVEADEVLLRRLFVILLDNAIKYAEPGGAVSVRCRAEAETFEIKISNTGAPISPDAQARIFERFYRADKARSHKDDFEFGTGAGLGLAIGSWIARIHAGRLELEKSDEAETIFLISLPRNFDKKSSG